MNYFIFTMIAVILFFSISAFRTLMGLYFDKLPSKEVTGVENKIRRTMLYLVYTTSISILTIIVLTILVLKA